MTARKPRSALHHHLDFEQRLARVSLGQLDPALEHDLARVVIAMRIAGSTGEWLQRMRGGEHVPTFESHPGDFKTALDSEVEKIARRLVPNLDPGAVVIGEEDGPDPRASRARVRYFIDPIDGTKNFINIGDDWCVSIAVEVDGVIVAAVAYQPGGRLQDAGTSRLPGVMYSAVLNGGAQVNGQPFRLVDRRIPLEQMTLQTGWTPDRLVKAGQFTRAASLSVAFTDVIRMGSAVLGGIRAARGDHIFFQGPLSPWDVLPVKLIAQEAGATCALRELPYQRNNDRTFEILVGPAPLVKEVNRLLDESPWVFKGTSNEPLGGFAYDEIHVPPTVVRTTSRDPMVLTIRPR